MGWIVSFPSFWKQELWTLPTQAQAQRWKQALTTAPSQPMPHFPYALQRGEPMGRGL